MGLLLIFYIDINVFVDGQALNCHIDHVLEGLVEVVADPRETAIKKKLMATILIDIFLAHELKEINLIWLFQHFLILYFLSLLRKLGI